MGLRCFLFSSDQGTIDSIGQILTGLDIEAESCSEAVTAVDKIANSVFQIVIVDWDKQPEASLLLSAARERKASERPVTLAIVSDDPSFPKALQAGANSVLRRPIVASQARDTLRTARDLLRSKRDASAPAASKSSVAAASAGSKSTIPASMDKGKERTLRAGEFLHSGSMTPGGSFETDADVSGAHHQPAPEPVDPLKDLEPVAASVTSKNSAIAPLQPGDEPRGLEWYMKARGIARPGPAAHAAAPAPASAPSSAKPELLGWEQAASAPAEKPNLRKYPFGTIEVAIFKCPGTEERSGTIRLHRRRRAGSRRAEAASCSTRKRADHRSSGARRTGDNGRSTGSVAFEHANPLAPRPERPARVAQPSAANPGLGPAFS